MIGAGLAGLSAARRLRRGGASVIVLEARGRPGGRVHSRRLACGRAIDLGAQFIGDGQRHVSALAAEAGLRRVSAMVPGDVLHLTAPRAGPQRLPPGALPLAALDRLDALQALWRLERSVSGLGPAEMAGLDRLDAASFLRGRTFLGPAFRALASRLEGEMCAPLAAVSTYELLEQLRSVGGFAGEEASARWFLAEGAEGLTRHLAREIGGALVLNAPVRAVAQDTGGVRVVSARGQHRAGHAIVAVPPQLYGAIGLLPLLPPAWRGVLAGWRNGSVVKTILVFAEPWWRRSGLSGTILGAGGRFGAAVDSSPADGGLGVLILFSTARSAQSLRRIACEPGRIAAALRWLRHAHDATPPDPLAAYSVDWSADPFSVGGYASRRGLGGWSGAPDLFLPLGRLHFAGTETASRWRSFMEGAVDSGWRAAGAVLGAARGTPGGQGSGPALETSLGAVVG